MLPAICLLLTPAFAATIEEDFAQEPGSRGWNTFGETGLFRWNSVAEVLEVTWDSSRPNSYFYHSLGTVLNKADDVEVSFELRLEDVAIGTNPGKPFTFEIAVGLFNLQDATRSNFFRGTANQSPNLLELDYFPDSGFGATVSPVIVSSNNQFVPVFIPLELTAGNTFRFDLNYRGADQTLTTLLHRDGEPIGPGRELKLGPTFGDFRVDTLSISSYSDQGAGGSIIARGSIDNIRVAVSDPPWAAVTGALAESEFRVRWVTETNWTYVLERTEDWLEWRQVSEVVPGTGEEQVLVDRLGDPAPSRAFYRVRLDKP